MRDLPFVAVAHRARADVRVWRIDLAACAGRVRVETLSAAERARAARLPPVHAHWFIARRYALRALLGAALGAPPAALAIPSGAHGKPELADARLHFNVSHSGTLCVIALSAQSAVGVDVEALAPMRDAAALARAHFTHAERRAWSHAGASPRAFLACWTRKEACLKALGVGLALEPAAVDTTGAAQARASAAVGGVTLELALYPLDGLPDAIGALALAAPDTARVACAAVAAA